MPAAARIADPKVCPDHEEGVIEPAGCQSVLIGGLPAARLGDATRCGDRPGVITTGETSVCIGGMAAARVGDLTSHDGEISKGCEIVLIGAPAQAVALRTAADQGAMFCQKCRS